MAAEGETRRDLEKPIQQLICDVHEEVNSSRRAEANLAHAMKRMVSMMGRVALEQSRSTRQLIWLTIAMTGFTVAVFLLTGALVWMELRGGGTAP